MYVGRILSSVKYTKGVGDNNSILLKGDLGERHESQRGQISQFLPTSRRIVQFSNGQVLILFGFHFSYQPGKKKKNEK